MDDKELKEFVKNELLEMVNGGLHNINPKKQPLTKDLLDKTKKVLLEE